MISLDPETSEHHPEVLRAVAQSRDGFAAVYAAVLVEGMVSQGDTIELID
jgi:MOSC domain-containing protein YiiM